jgi:arylformamidase
VQIKRVLDMARGDRCNVSQFDMCAHTGTHMDASLHFLAQVAGLDQMPFEATIGPARVIAIKDRESIQPEELRRHRIQRGERLLLTYEFQVFGLELRGMSGEVNLIS